MKIVIGTYPNTYSVKCRNTDDMNTITMQLNMMYTFLQEEPNKSAS